jgi:hypothetical protein
MFKSVMREDTYALLSSFVVGIALARISISSMLCSTALAFTGTLDSLKDGPRFLCFFSGEHKKSRL